MGWGTTRAKWRGRACSKGSFFHRIGHFVQEKVGSLSFMVLIVLLIIAHDIQRYNVGENALIS